MKESYLKDKEENPDSPFILHFRIATSGEKDETNTHPHQVGEDLYMVHNGVMHSWAKGDKKSDTVHFTKEILATLYKEYGGPGFLMSEPVTYLLEDCLGLSNKMVFMSPEHVFILNQKQGSWVNGVWFSNTHFVPISTPAHSPTSYYGNHSHGYYGADGRWRAYDNSSTYDEKKKSKMEETNGQERLEIPGCPVVIAPTQSTVSKSSKSGTGSAISAGTGTQSKHGVIISYSHQNENLIFATVRYENLTQQDTVKIQKVYYADGTEGFLINLEDFFVENHELCFPDLQKAKAFIYMMAIGESYAAI